MTKQDCKGCRDDFYNGTGATECWMFKDAKLITRYAIGFWTPMDTARNLREVVKPQCYHEQGSSRTVYMNAVPDHLRAEWHQLQREKRRDVATDAAR